jgi:hypothetical protein
MSQLEYVMECEKIKKEIYDILKKSTLNKLGIDMNSLSCQIAIVIIQEVILSLQGADNGSDNS